MEDRRMSRTRVAVAGAIGVTLVLALARAIYGALNQRMRKAETGAEMETPETDEAGEVWVVVDEVWIT